jgi:hypothetical protein
MPATPATRYGQSARPPAEGLLLRSTEQAASQPNSGRLETSVRRRILHASHHALPTSPWSGGGHKRAKKGTFYPASSARKAEDACLPGITYFARFGVVVVLVLVSTEHERPTRGR